MFSTNTFTHTSLPFTLLFHFLSTQELVALLTSVDCRLAVLSLWPSTLLLLLGLLNTACLVEGQEQGGGCYRSRLLIPCIPATSVGVSELYGCELLGLSSEITVDKMTPLILELSPSVKILPNHIHTTSSTTY